MKIIKILAYIVLGFIVLFIGVAIVAGIFAGDAQSKDKAIEPAQKVELQPEAIKEVEPKYLWEYSESVNEMDNKTNYFASITSDNELDFDFPYQGGSSGSITIRNMDGKNTVAISIEKGQFMPNFMDSEYIRVKFDDDELEKYSYAMAADGSSNIIFPNQSSKLINKLKKSKTIKVEAAFYNEGRQVLNFSTQGLQWDK